jgi:outer membrane protein assembly factor BamB
MWCGHPTRNKVSSETGLPSVFGPKSGEYYFTGCDTVNLRWVAKLGSHAYGSPVVFGGKVFVGTENCRYDSRRKVHGGAMLCFDAQTGQFLWQLVIPQLPPNDKVYNLANYCYGVTSTPAVEGNRLYFMSSRDELLCLDIQGQAKGNDGPFKDEMRYMSDRKNPLVPLCSTDADIIWRLDMIKDRDVGACPTDSPSSSVLIMGNYLYVSPSNGVEISKPHIPNQNAPSLVVVDKRTGRVVAREQTRSATRVFHGEWSSASTGRIGGRNLIFYGTGDGNCYAFDAIPTPPAKGQRIGTIKTVWRFDVNAAAGRIGKYRAQTGPSEIIATPVFYKGRIYVGTGQDPTHGPGHGALVCIDPTKTGDITKTGMAWLFKDIARSISTVAIADDLVYAADNWGSVYCLDSNTGKLYWKHETKQRICSSPVVADGKVYLCTDSGDVWVFATGKTAKVLGVNHLGSGIEATPAVANGTIYIAAQGRLFAVGTRK